ADEAVIAVPPAAFAYLLGLPDPTVLGAVSGRLLGRDQLRLDGYRRQLDAADLRLPFEREDRSARADILLRRGTIEDRQRQVCRLREGMNALARGRLGCEPIAVRLQERHTRLDCRVPHLLRPVQLAPGCAFDRRDLPGDVVAGTDRLNHSLRNSLQVDLG